MQRGSGRIKDGVDGGTWYLAQVADGAWCMRARAATEVTPRRVLAELSGYPAVVTANGNLFHLGTSLARLAASRNH